MKNTILIFIFFVFSSQAKYNAVNFSLKNGLLIVCVEKKMSPIVSFSIWYKCGSKCDMVSKSGVAHYLEHMAFVSNKGVFNDFLEEIGANSNAFTSMNTICFYETVPKDRIEDIFKHEAIRMESIDIEDKIFIAEKGAILEERNMRIDNSPEGAQQESDLTNIFNREAGGISVIGWKHEIKSLRKQDLYDFHEKWFAPNNAVIVIVGDFEQEQIKRLSEKYFGNIKAKKIPEKIAIAQKPCCFKDIKFSSPKQGAFSAIEYIYYVPFLSQKDFRKSIVLDLAVKVMSQPAFFVKKSLKHVLNSAINVSFGYMERIFQYDIVSVSISCSSINDLHDSERIWGYLRNKLIGVGISEKELSNIKRKESISLAYKKDDIEQVSSYFGWLLIRGYSIDEIQSIDETIQSISAKECNEVLREIFLSDPIAISRMVPKGYDRD